MPSITVSSGDPVADRRLLWAESLFDEGNAAEAASLLAEAMPQVPHWAGGWYRLGEFYEAAGDAAAAAAAWEQALGADPSDRLGAALRRDLLLRATASEHPEAALAQMPSAFVETLFDAYANEFDASLARLDYRGPQLVAAEVARLGRIGRALDLGCGTGLLGAELRGLVDWLEGCDISSEMLARAEARGLYDLLLKRDLTAMPPASPQYNLIAAADVVMYIGALEDLLNWSAKSLLPGGALVFTAEAMAGSSFALGETRRYRHSALYLTEALTKAGFETPVLSPAVVRQDRGQPVEALVISTKLPLAGAQSVPKQAASLPPAESLLAADLLKTCAKQPSEALAVGHQPTAA